MSILASLIEQRDAAQAKFTKFAEPIIAENRNLTEDEDKKHAKLRSRVAELDRRIEEAEKDAKRDAKVVQARGRLLGADASADGSKVHVRNEPMTYGPDSPNSYVADFVRATGYGGQRPPSPEALQRLNKWGLEVEAEVRSGSKIGRRAMSVIREGLRDRGEADSRLAFQNIMEARSGMDTTSNSGGSFVTPQYFVSDYAPYREFGRIFLGAANVMPLPDYGMTVYLPQVNTAAGVAAQVGQNQGIDEQDPNADYLSANLNTLAGEVTVSQQLLDRAGPNFAYDKMIFDQLNRAYNQQADTFALTQALAGAGTVSYTTAWQITSTTGTTSSLYSKVAQAKAATVDAAGVVLPATHLFAEPVRWEYITAFGDTVGRPLIVPDYAGVFNAVAACGDGTPIAEGDTGMKLLGLKVMEDGNIPAPASGTDQIIVAHMPEVWVWEGAQVPRVIPQTYAQNLSVLLQTYAYIAVIVRYPLAVQAISGTAFATPTF